MKHFSLIIFLLLFLILSTLPVFGQRQVLVSPEGDIITLNPGDDPRRIVKQRSRPSQTAVCFSQFQFGYELTHGYPPNTMINARHGEILGEWFVAKATGTIDTIYWGNLSAGSAVDSSVLLRVHRSYIGPDYGPGIRPGPFNPPCQQWGYWVDANNPDGGIAAFPEWATDTTWHSTIQGSPAPSTPPIGEILWGFSGFPVKANNNNSWVNPGSIAAMDALSGPISVTVGDKFFVSLEVPRGCHPECPPGGDDEIPTTLLTDSYVVAPSDEDYPSRFWKFYQHDQGAFCAADSVSRGWVARGSFGGDSTEVVVLPIMYSMTVTENVPPVFVDSYDLNDDLHSTFNTAARQVSMIIEDCNPANPGNAGVAGAYLRYSVDGSPQPNIPLVDAGADVWQGAIPGQPPGSSVTYQSVAWDIDGDTGTGPSFTYTVVPFGTEWYSIDTGYACSPTDIGPTGTALQTTDFFLPPWASPEALATDDGTSGPYDMGASFLLFGKPFRYAWIGVNGAIALSESPTDTQDVNANGEWPSAPWNIPGPQKQGRGDEITGGGMPGIYIAPLAADHILEDSNDVYGRILQGNGGDSCRFIVQWDSIGGKNYWYPYNPSQDINTFRVILNRCSGAVELQYESVRYSGDVSSGHVGMQAASTLISAPDPGYVLLNNLGYPIETRPYDGYCVRFHPAVGMVVGEGWNLVSVPMVALDDDFTPSALFPEVDATWYPFPYNAPPPAELLPGAGYWVKITDGGKIGRAPGALLHGLSVPVTNGWNIIGGPSEVVPAASIEQTGTTITSLFYGYGSGGYSTATALEPGKAYWVKVSGDGTLGLTSSSTASARGSVASIDIQDLNQISITDARGRSQTLYLAGSGSVKRAPDYAELPPSPPAGAFDVRFASGKWLEEYPEGPQADLEYPLTIGGAAYPVIVRWEIRHSAGEGRSFLLGGLVDGSGIAMEGSGSAVLDDPAMKTVTISLTDGRGIPAVFELGHNYPNPFNPGTTITYAIAKPGIVRLKVFNMIGEEVASLVDATLPPGNYTTEWEPAGLPSGIYFCRLSAGEYTQTRKLVLMR